MFAYYGPEWESLQNRMIGRWCPSFPGATGLQLPDTMGTNHGTLTNFANNGNDSYVASPGRLALNFDGVNDNVEIAANNRLALNINNGNFTVSFWARVESAISGGLCSLASSANVLRWNINTGIPINFTGGQLPTGGIAISRAASVIGGSTVVFPVGVFVHVLAAFTSTSNTVFLNGEPSPIVGGLPNTGIITRIFLGSSASGGAASSFGQCQLDDFIFFGGVLTANEGRFIYEQGRGGGMLYQPPRRRSYSAAATTNRRRRLLLGAEC